MASQDFFGFWFNGVHSSELGFKRVSNGSRYQENILPAFQDKTVPVPGGDGAYYFDTNYNNKTFQIQIATDRMTELQYRKLRQIFDAKNTGPLIFDESPYKVYTAKVQSPPQFNFICFDEPVTVNGVQTNQRIYKGEGTIQFICYYPYAKSYYKYLDQYVDEQEKPAGVPYWNNRDEWAEASGMLASQVVDSTVYDGYNSNEINLYNAGDIEADSIIWLPMRDETELYEVTTLYFKYSLMTDLNQRNRYFYIPPWTLEDTARSKKGYIPKDDETFNEAVTYAIGHEGVVSDPLSSFRFLYNEDYIIKDNYVTNGTMYDTYQYSSSYPQATHFRMVYKTQPYSGLPYTNEKVIFLLWTRTNSSGEYGSNTEFGFFKPTVGPQDTVYKIRDGELTMTTSTVLTLQPENTPYAYYLNFSKPEDVSGAAYLSVDSKTNIINYCDVSKEPIRSANELIKAGDFFKIPRGKSVISTESSSKIMESVQYDYLYY